MQYILIGEEIEGKAPVLVEHRTIEGLPQSTIDMCIQVTEIPQPAIIRGKDPFMYYDVSNQSIVYEYVDRPLSDRERLEALQEQNAQMMLALVMNDLI